MKTTSLLYALVLSALSISSYAQDSDEARNEKLFNGIVTDFTGSPIRNARIYLHTPKIYSVSDRKGRFGLSEVNDDDTLHIIYKKQQYDIALNGSHGARIKLADQLNATSIEEDEQLVDLGYGFIKRREHTGSSNGLTRDELQRTGKIYVMEALQARVPGLQIQISNIPGEQSKACIRGRATIYGDTTPLYLVDGAEVPSLDHIMVTEIDYVEVIKDANIYGVRGANGVISVHSRNAISN